MTLFNYAEGTENSACSSASDRMNAACAEPGRHDMSNFS